jgi:protease I
MSDLSGFRVAVLATDGFEESELTEPAKALRDAGADVQIVSVKTGEIQGVRHDVKGTKVAVDRRLKDVNCEDYDGVLLPGGALNADAMRMVPEVHTFLRAMEHAGKPIAAICHAPWELISAGLVKDRTLTSYYTIQDDVRNAGAHWEDREVVTDGKWVTSRQPDDLPAFNDAMLKVFAATREEK